MEYPRLSESGVGRGWTIVRSLAAIYRIITVLLAATLFPMGVTVNACGQSSTTTLRGTVTDPQSAVVAGAEVLLVDPVVAFSRRQKTDDHGVYQFLQVPPGNYTVSVSAVGFTTSRNENVILQVNTPTTLEFCSPPRYVHHDRGRSRRSSIRKYRRRLAGQSVRL